MKAVSPLVATIMLIALALAVSGVFFSWLSQFTYSHRDELQACSRARIALQRAYYNPETGNITLMVYNNGDIPLKGFSILVSYPDDAEMIRDFITRELKQGDTLPFLVRYSGSIKTITVQSVECRNAQDMINIHDVKRI